MKSKANKKKRSDDKSQNTKEFKPKDISDIENPTRLDLLNVIVHNSQALSPAILTGGGITLLIFLFIFGKVIVATTLLSGIGYTAGRIVRRIRRKKECSI